MGKTIRIRTPLVMITTLAVAALGVLRAVLVEGAWPSSILAALFMPAAVTGLAVLGRRSADPERARRLGTRLRTSLVAAGVLLGTALLLSTTDTLGWTASDSGGRPVLAILAAAVAAAADVISTRLERAAEREQD